MKSPKRMFPDRELPGSKDSGPAVAIIVNDAAKPQTVTPPDWYEYDFDPEWDRCEASIRAMFARFPVNDKSTFVNYLQWLTGKLSEEAGRRNPKEVDLDES